MGMSFIISLCVFSISLIFLGYLESQPVFWITHWGRVVVFLTTLISLFSSVVFLILWSIFQPKEFDKFFHSLFP